jgi:hypothetical protein
MLAESTSLSERSRRTMVRTGGWAAVAVVFAVLLVGSASGAPAPSVASPVTKTWSAPYTGGAGFSLIIGTTDGCSAVGLPVPPSFNTTTGVGYLSSNGSARSCPGVNSSLLWEMDDVLEGPSSTTTTGVHDLKASWGLNFAVDLAAHRGKATQNATASFEVEIILELVKLTSSQSLPGTTNSTLYSQSIYTGTYSHTYRKVPVTTDFNATLSKKAHYAFEAYVYSEIYLFVSPGSSSASASVNMGSAGNDVVLKSVTMS